MLEIPEAQVLAAQINHDLSGKSIQSFLANSSPHKFAWYHGEPERYDELLAGIEIKSAQAWGGLVEIAADNVRLVFGDGVALRLLAPGEKRPAK